MQIYKYIAVLLVNVLSYTAFTQDLSSPYSFYGIGDINYLSFSQSRAMGGISFGLRSFNQINYRNPASCTAQDTNSFMLDVGLMGSFSKISSDQLYENMGSSNLYNVSMQFPIMKWWKAGMGIVPYSVVGYNIVEEKTEESLEMYYSYKGVGGLNQFYISNAFLLAEQLSLGFNFNYLFGGFTHIVKQEFPPDGLYPDITIKEKYDISDVGFTLGLQYFGNVDKKYYYTVGAVFENSNKLATTYQKLKFKEYANVIDTIYPGEGDGDGYENINIEMPLSYGVGFTFERKDKYIVGFDFYNQAWQQSSSSLFENFSNSQTYNLGFEYIPEKYAFRGYLKRIRYRCGAYYNKSFLSFNNQQIDEKAATFGLGFPFKYSQTTFNLSVDAGQRGTTNEGLVKEGFVNILFNLTFYDFWFFKARYD